MLKKICEELEVEVGEEWIGLGVYQNPPTYKIQDNILWIYHTDDYEDEYSWKEASMADYVSLIKGELKPVWMPEIGEEFCVIDLLDEDLYDVTFWSDNKINHQWLERGLVFKTSEEAIECANKMLESVK